MLRISDITIGERIREDYGAEDEWKEFKESFVKYGQLQAISVVRDNGAFQLESGGRRLRAIDELWKEAKVIPGLEKGMIRAEVTDRIPSRVRLIKEFEENMQRKDFNFVEKAKFIRKFHEQMLREVGETWTQEMTAWTLHLSKASISHYLRLEEAVKGNETIAKAGTLDAAIKRMKVQEELTRRHTAAKIDNNSFQRASQMLVHGDATEWIQEVKDASVDFINFDPPWGDNASHKAAENHEAFDDSTEYADNLMRLLFPHLFRILREDRFCIFWHRMWASEQMAGLAIEHGFNLTHTRTPAIWFKVDKVTDQNRDPEKRLTEAYEPFYILRKGDPVFHEKFANNVFAFDRVPLGSIIHPTEKPVPLCTTLLKLLTVPGEVVFDPTAGSASMLDAALRTSRKAFGCELSKEYHERGLTRLADFLKTYSEA